MAQSTASIMEFTTNKSSIVWDAGVLQEQQILPSTNQYNSLWLSMSLSGMIRRLQAVFVKMGGKVTRGRQAAAHVVCCGVSDRS
jgi:hypothetical protein